MAPSPPLISIQSVITSGVLRKRIMLSFHFKVVSVAVFLGLGSLCTQSIATDNITDAELLAIPSWCQDAFRKSDYIEKMAPKMGFSSPSVTGGGGKSASSLQIPGGHHTCAGMVEFNRAKRGKGSYTIAAGEFNYSFSRMSPGHPSLSFVASHLGRALYMSGKRQQGVDVWRSAIGAQPAQRESYLALAEALLDAGRNEDALNVMLEFDKAKDREYADAEQFMAQTYFKLKQYEKAKSHAEKALQLGYPFTGLMEKIRKMEGTQ